MIWQQVWTSWLDRRYCRYCLCQLMMATFAFAYPVVAQSAEDLAKSTWEIPSHDVVAQEVDKWITESGFDDEVAKTIRVQWQEPLLDGQRLDLLANHFAMGDDPLGELMQLSLSHSNQLELPDVSFLDELSHTPFVRDHAKLIYGRWLAQNQFYNETLDQLSSLKTEDLIDPASLLFYQSIANYRLLKKAECLPIVDRLLEKEELLPRRFSILAAMIRDDIKPLKEDSLDEISRLMDSIKVRLGHGRAGKRVRTEEDDVIKKLDKMIKELEDKAQQQQQSMSQGQGGQPGDNLNPAAPMQDSMPGGGRGPGNIDVKDLGKQDGWGDLPPKERQQALQQLGKDFPSHYRDVIEEYFRKLAQEGSDN